jgi:uncharacterized protein YyaL (SSP411 family)
LPVRPKEIYDGANPSANAVALNNLILLARLTGETRWMDRAVSLTRAFAGTIRRQLPGYTHSLSGWYRLLEGNATGVA